MDRTLEDIKREKEELAKKKTELDLEEVKLQIEDVKKDIEEQSENGGSAVDLLWDLQMGLPNLEKKEARLEKKLGIKHETPEKESGSKKEAKTVKINKLTADSEEELKVMLGYAAKYLNDAAKVRKEQETNNDQALIIKAAILEKQGKVLALSTFKEYADLLFDDEEQKNKILEGTTNNIPELNDLIEVSFTLISIPLLENAST